MLPAPGDAHEHSPIGRRRADSRGAPAHAAAPPHRPTTSHVVDADMDVPCELMLPPASVPIELLGCGLRTITFLAFHMYIVGLYVDRCRPRMGALLAHWKVPCASAAGTARWARA